MPAESSKPPGTGRTADQQRLSLRFLTSAPSRRQAPPPDQPEIAVAGRSNAGKSSVLNRLSGNRRTAKVSRTPGRTQLLNFFEIIDHGAVRGRLVDLPGYGYAKATRDAQNTWQRAVNDYLDRREALIGVILVMDIRHPLQPFDRDLLSWAAAAELPLLVLLNKADKLKQQAQMKTLRDVSGALSTYGAVELDALCFSALRGQGQPELLARLKSWLDQVTEVDSAADATDAPDAPAEDSDGEG